MRNYLSKSVIFIGNKAQNSFSISIGIFISLGLDYQLGEKEHRFQDGYVLQRQFNTIHNIAFMYHSLSQVLYFNKTNTFRGVLTEKYD